MKLPAAWPHQAMAPWDSAYYAKQPVHRYFPFQSHQHSTYIQEAAMQDAQQSTWKYFAYLPTASVCFYVAVPPKTVNFTFVFSLVYFIYHFTGNVAPIPRYDLFYPIGHTSCSRCSGVILGIADNICFMLAWFVNHHCFLVQEKHIFRCSCRIQIKSHLGKGQWCPLQGNMTQQ